jgi:hypothetical protein
MTTLGVSPPLRVKLGESGSEGLQMMFAEAHRIATESFERRLADEMAKMQLTMDAGFSNLKFEILKWSFLFWIGQAAVVAGMINLMLRG